MKIQRAIVGVYYQHTPPDIYIDVTKVTSLINHSLTNQNSNLVVGANVPLQEAMELFQDIGSKYGNFSYLTKVAEHISLVAHIAVRNIGTIAGNLSTKYLHNEFPSDIFLILETVSATLKIVDSSGQADILTPAEYLNFNMNKKVIENVTLPSLDDTYVYQSYKIMPVAQDAHAIVNAGFLLKFNQDNTIQSARIVYGGINPQFIHASRTEQYLSGKNPFDDDVLQGAYKILDAEVNPDVSLPGAPPAYRKGLSMSLLYKFILSIAPKERVSERNLSGGRLLERPVSTGTEKFQTNKSMYPVTEPVPKIEGILQTSGELEYITDMIDSPGVLHAHFVTADVIPLSEIVSIDPSEALNMAGVVAYYDKKDLPGPNTILPPILPPFAPIVLEPLFCNGTVLYYHQPVGVIVAETPELAERAAKMVKIKYEEGPKPFLTIRQILEAPDANKRIHPELFKPAIGRGIDVKHVIKGTHGTNWQYHYHMETQNCVAYPKSDSLDVYPGSQWPDYIQQGIANILKIPQSKINCTVPRLGGAFGGKISRNLFISLATGLCAFKLGKPVGMRMSMISNMDIIGKRPPTAADYEVGVDDNGVIQYMVYNYYFDYGTGGNAFMATVALDSVFNCYKSDSWFISAHSVNTDRHTSTWCRAPGSVNGAGMIESLMEHLAIKLNKSSLDIRKANMDPILQAKILAYVDAVAETSDYKKREKEVEEFNKANRWRKRGISLVPMSFDLIYFGAFRVIVAICTHDGSVAVSSGGVEMGQGLNTKVVQAVAYALNVPMHMVHVKATNSLTSAANIVTGGSQGSEACVFAAIKACEILKGRMEPIKLILLNPPWIDLVRACWILNMDLTATYQFNPLSTGTITYPVYGAAVGEVEVDILTGNHIIRRVDIVEDTGNSISPSIDMGQVEGGFVMGLGLWTTENVQFDSDGRIVTNRSWNYKIPGPKDIPVDFRVTFPANNPNPTGVLKSKATGEPAILLSAVVPLAIRRAVASARKDSDSKADLWYPFDGPSTVDNTFLNSLNDYTQYKLM